MKRIAIFVTLLTLAVSNAMSKNDTISVHNALLQLQNEVVFNKDYNETPYYKLQDVKVPNNDVFSVFTDDWGENIGFLSIDPATRNEKRPKALLSVYRVSDGKKLYSKVFKWNDDDYVLSKTSISEMSMNNVSTIDLDSKAVLLNLKSNEMFFGHVNDNLLLFSQNRFSDYAKVTAYSMTTGEKIWQEKKLLNIDDGLTYNQTIDSISDYVISRDLIRINWQTGEMKKLESKTTITNKKTVFTSILIGVAAGVAAGIAGGMMGVNPSYYPVYIPTYRSFNCAPSAYKIAGLHSNIIPELGKNYFADRNCIRCFNDDMTEIWKTEFPEKATQSQIFLKNDTVFMVSNALAIYGSGQIQHKEKPFIAAFNANDGYQLFFQPVEIDESVNSATKSNNTLRLLFNDSEAIYDLTTNKMNIAPHDTTITGAYSFYIVDDKYLKKNADNTFTAINSANDSVLIMTNKGNILNMSTSSPTKEYMPQDIYVVTSSLGENSFVEPLVGHGHKHDLWCINKGKATLVSNDVIYTERKEKHLILYLTGERLQILKIK